MKAIINVKEYGIIIVELYETIAPITVKNFVELANKGFYNNLTFHRVIKEFMIQGGCPLGNGTGGPGYSIYGEFKENGFDNSLSHERGVISMARTSNPNSAGSQFFIMHKDGKFLDGKYAAFGKVTKGIEVVDKIANTKTNFNDKPVKNVIITSIDILEDM